MTHTRYRVLQAAVLLGLAFFLLERIVSGKLLLYINARFAVLTVLGVVGLFALAVSALAGLRRPRQAEEAGHECDEHGCEAHGQDPHGHHHSIGNLFWVALPLALGLLAPARSLSLEAVQSRGVSFDAAPGSAAALQAYGQSQLRQQAPEERTVLDWIRLVNAPDAAVHWADQTANVVGFVYEDQRLPEGHFLVARFTVSCCVADAFAIGMAVAWPEELPAGTWVQVRGPVRQIEIEGQRLPLIVAESIREVAEPAQPYLFP